MSTKPQTKTQDRSETDRYESMSVEDLIPYLRVTERAIMILLFAGTIIFLLYLYRNDVVGHRAEAELGSAKIAAVITLPIIVALIVLGYVLITVSHPISLSYAPQNSNSGTALSEAKFFEGTGLSQTFTNLASREGGLEGFTIVRAQSLLRLSLDIEKARVDKDKAQIEKLLRDPSLSVKAIRDALDENP